MPNFATEKKKIEDAIDRIDKKWVEDWNDRTKQLKASYRAYGVKTLKHSLPPRPFLAPKKPKPRFSNDMIPIGVIVAFGCLLTQLGMLYPAALLATIASLCVWGVDSST